MSVFDEEPAAALGSVVEAGRGSLPFALIHGEAVVAAAAWALGEAGVIPVDLTTGWDDVVHASVESGAPYVLHDCLCPMTPPAFIAQCVGTATESGAIVVGVRPVTDTIKRVLSDDEGDRVGATLDRDALATICSPVVIPAVVLAQLDDLGGGPDFAALVADLGARFEGRVEIRLVEAPPEARRVADRDALAVLEALTGDERGGQR